MKSIFKKKQLSPVMLFSFIIVGVTGILMLIHLKNGVIKNLHEWMGVLFVFAGLIHLILNRRILLSYLKGSHALVSAVIILIISSLIMMYAPCGKDNGAFVRQGKGAPGFHHRR